MDVWSYDGQRFEVVMASDVIRDGMGLELTALDGPAPGPVFEAFWHDDDGRFEFVACRSVTLPFSVIDRFVAEAKKRLPPVDAP
jgi:hypothetical protein